MPQKLNMQRPSSLHSMQLIALLILSCSYIINHAFAFTSCSPPAIASRNIATVNIRIQQPPSTKLHYSTNNNNNNNNNDNNTSKKTRQQQKVQVAGVSVSPLGFLVILQSIMNDGTNNDQKKKMLEVAFPILLTSSGISTASNSNDSSINNNLTIPTLFQENIDQTSVTTPEALTFLQLLNGVDMATPILPPDTLSNVCVWYAFLLEEQLLEEGDDVEGEGIGDGGLLYEDELGLETSSSTTSSTQPSNAESNEQKEEEEEYHDKYSSALNYIRGMVRTTLPPSKDGSYFVNYIDASEWQRARVQLPRVWLYGVRMEMMDLTLFQNNDDEDDGGTLSSSSAAAVGVVGRVPVKYTLQCSVDDGLKRLEIPLFAIPSSYQLKESTSSSSRLKRQLDISNEILQELSHNYTPETSASFLSLALYHRYNKSNQQGSSSSNANNNDGPTLKVDEDLLNQLVQMQQQQKLKSKQYCWPTSIRSIIQANGLPMYRPLHQIQEEDQRVLERIYGGNDDDLDNGGGSGGMEDDASLSSSDTSKKEPKKKALTLEQQALQQRLKSAWKIAMQRGDEGALEKIQKAMEDLEKELIIVEEEDTSTLDRIQRAMRERDEVLDGGGDEEEEVVGLVSDLEEAIRMEGSSSDGDDREEEL